MTVVFFMSSAFLLRRVGEAFVARNEGMLLFRVGIESCCCNIQRQINKYITINYLYGLFIQQLRRKLNENHIYVCFT